MKRGNMVKSAKRKLPPSRTRYEQSHPVVSFRVPRDIYDELQRVKEEGDRSFTDILKQGMGKAEHDSRKAAKIRQESLAEGYRKGYSEAELKYKVTYHCSMCGQTMEVTHENEKRAITEFMAQAGWQHSECRRRIR